ncbi:MAG: UDP-N-acetylglucosamine 2-epimerase (hydrolyzing) [Nitrospirae bacterium]|nr:UDP-N-acetylglucosamine 2-epimerase (hydrolyzing) [Nitrospirota bacterium]
MRKIAVVTATRAEYGLLFWIIKAINDDHALQLQLIVSGMHLSPEFGMTVDVIEQDGFKIDDKVYMLLSSDSESAIAISMGLGMIGFARTYERLDPDVLVVLGDRFDILSAVAASVPFRIPVAHIHGGESTEGAIDDPIRHAVTKMSHLHFTATDKYRNIVIQMGESPERVFVVGAPGLDNIYKLKLLDIESLYSELEIPENMKIGLLTYHPVTLEHNSADICFSEILKSLMDFKSIYWIFTLPNADTGGRSIIKMINDFILNSSPHVYVKVFSSLGQLRYLSLLKHAVVMVGNSSSGLIEAPAFELPVVNIGNRQNGRIHADNVIDVSDCTYTAISEAIQKAVSDDFRISLKGLNNPYGQGNASIKIVEILKNVHLGESLIKKTFYKLPMQFTPIG